MKRFLTLVCVALMTSALAMAQPGGGFGGGMPGGGMPGMSGGSSSSVDTKEIATKMADRLKEQLDLTDQQYKKVFKVYRQEAQYQNNTSSMSGFGGGMPGGGFGGGMPGGMGPGMGGGMPEGAPSMGSLPEGAPEFDKDKAPGMLKLDEKGQEKVNKKFEKILTPEQYKKYLNLQMAPEFPKDGQRPERPEGLNK